MLGLGKKASCEGERVLGKLCKRRGTPSKRVAKRRKVRSGVDLQKQVLENWIKEDLCRKP